MFEKSATRDRLLSPNRVDLRIVLRELAPPGDEPGLPATDNQPMTIKMLPQGEMGGKAAKFVGTDPGLGNVADFAQGQENAGQRLAFGRQTHIQGLGNHEYESTYQQTPRLPPRPGNI